MKNPAISFAVLLCAVLLCACQRPAENVRMTIPFVRNILANKNSAEAVVLSSYPGAVREAAIYVVGDPATAKRYSRSLVSCDLFDNISGVPVPDLLPDFAGETISCISDDVSAPYSEFLNDGRENDLRATVVTEAVQAIDTLSHLSLYDVNGLGKKLTAKIIVMSSPYAAAYGLFDVDTLFRASGCGAFVVNPTVEAFNSAFDSSCFTIAVISDKETLENRVHEKYFYDEVAARKIVGANCFIYAPGGYEGEDVVASMLDAYIAKGDSRRLEGVIIDNPDIDPQKVRASLMNMTDVMCEEYVLYSHVVSSDIRVFDTEEELRHRCHSILRENNLFTHNIYLPKLQEYRRMLNLAGVGTIIVEN